jgi:transposase, IS5 family
MYQGKDRLTTPMFGDMFDFASKLDKANRWLKIADLIPWTELERLYDSRHSDVGRPAKDSRLVIGLLLLKHLTGLSDEEMVLSVRENPYQQVFCGLDAFKVDAFIDSSTLTKQRKRLGLEFFKELEAKTYQALIDRKIIRAKAIFVDATVFPENIKYPNDVGLLNDAREWLVKTVKAFGGDLGKTIRTYTRKARQVFLDFSKKKVKKKKTIEKAKKKMLQYVRRNLTQLEKLMAEATEKGLSVTKKIEEKFKVAKTIFEQQLKMYQSKRCQIPDRIVSFFRPQVRPIVRGKAGKNVEFGAKASCVNVDGFVMMDHVAHAAYGEESDVPAHIEAYEKRFGVLPPSMTGDGKYGTRINRELLDAKGVRSGFKPLGRTANASTKKTNWYRQKQRERNRIEGSFGNGKMHYGLDRVMYSIQGGSETWIRLGLLSMNLKTALARS